MRVPLELQQGIVSDETTFSAPGYYADGSNVRFRFGKPETIGGWEAFTADVLTGVCRTALAWIDSLSQLNIAFGTHTNLIVIKSGDMYDISPAALPVGEIDTVAYDGGYGSGGYGMVAYGINAVEDVARTWSLCNWGENLIASPAGGSIYIWANAPLAPATVIATAPPACNRVLVTPQRQVLAFGCEEELSGLFNPMCIRGSDIEDYTNWTTSSSNNAFEHILEGGGYIVDAKIYGTSVIVWTDSAVFLGEFIGEADQAYRFDKIASGCGLVGPQAAVVFNQTAYWLTPDLQFYMWTYGTQPTPLPCRIRREFIENIDTAQLAKVVAVTIGKFQEIWWLYPDQRDVPGQNMLSDQNDFSASAWAKTNITVTANSTAAPDGTMTADTLTITSTAHTIEEYITVAPKTTYTMSWYVKRGTATDLAWGVWDITNSVDLVAPTSYYTETGADWVRVSKTFTTAAGCVQIAPSPVKYGSSTGTVHLWGARLEPGSVADGSENSRFVSVCVGEAEIPWSKGNVARTAMLASGPLPYPLGVDYAGQSYYHEKGNDADGSALSWSIRTSLQYIDEGQSFARLNGLWPDFEAQQGGISLTLYTRVYPQSDDVTWGPYVSASAANRIDFLAEGRLIALEFSGSAAPTFARLGKPTFDVIPTGRQ